jgi:hypothetical protein
MCAFHGTLLVGDDSALIGEIVRAANALDEMMEWLPFEHQTNEGALCRIIRHQQAESVAAIFGGPRDFCFKYGSESLEAFGRSTEFAMLCGCDPEDAFTAGLLHDVARLATEKLDRETSETRARLKIRHLMANRRRKLRLQRRILLGLTY